MAADLTAIYQQLLGRAPDAGAASFYGGMDDDAIRRAILASAEYYGRVNAPQPVAPKPTPTPTVPTTPGMPTTPGANTGGLGGLGGFDMNALLQQFAQNQQSQMSAWQQSQQQMMNGWQQALGANFGKTYNPTGVGGSFSNVNSPVYRPGGQTDTGTQAANGWGGSWGNGPFRATF